MKTCFRSLGTYKSQDPPPPYSTPVDDRSGVLCIRYLNPTHSHEERFFLHGNNRGTCSVMFLLDTVPCMDGCNCMQDKEPDTDSNIERVWIFTLTSS